MEISFKLFSNFTQQLKFISIVLGITVLILGIDGNLGSSRYFYFVVNCFVFGITGVLFLGTAFDALKDTESLRKFEQIFHIGSGGCLILGSIITLCDPPGYWAFNSSLSSALIGLLVYGPLNLLLGWQLCGAYEREPDSFRPIYLSIGLSHTPLKFVEDVAPPKYTEAYSATLLARRNAPPNYPQNTSVQVHQPHHN